MLLGEAVITSTHSRVARRMLRKPKKKKKKKKKKKRVQEKNPGEVSKVTAGCR